MWSLRPRLADAGPATEVEDGTICCYALQDKVWVDGPAGHRWEIYTVLADAGAELEGRTDDHTGLAGTPTAAAEPSSETVEPTAACCG